MENTSVETNNDRNVLSEEDELAGRQSKVNNSENGRQLDRMDDLMLTPETPKGVTLPGFNCFSNQIDNVSKHLAVEDFCEWKGVKDSQCWTEILTVVQNAKTHARALDSQADRLESMTEMIDSIVDNILDGKMAMEEKNRNLSRKVSSLQLEIKGQQGEYRVLQGTVESLTKSIASEEHARRRIEQRQESQEMEWNSLKGRMRMELELAKGLLSMQKQKESLHRQELARSLESYRLLIEQKNVELQGSRDSLQELQFTTASLHEKLEASRESARKHHEEALQAQQMNTLLSLNLEKARKDFDTEKLRMEEVFRSHKDAHQACLEGKNTEITSLRELHDSFRDENDSKITRLASEVEALKASLNHTRKENGVISGKLEQERILRQDIQDCEKSLKFQLSEAENTIKQLQASTLQSTEKNDMLEKKLKDERERIKAVQKDMEVKCDESNAKIAELETSHTTLQIELQKVSTRLENLNESYQIVSKDYENLLKSHSQCPKQDKVTEQISKRPLPPRDDNIGSQEIQRSKYSRNAVENDTSGNDVIHAVRPAAKRALQKRMKAQRMVNDQFA